MTCRHWLIIAAGVLIAFGPCALVYNVWSIFVVPVSSSLGVASSQFTFFITLVYLVGGIAAPFAGNLLQKYDLRIVLSVSVAMVALGLFLCSFWNHIYLFYVSGVMVGFGIVSLMFLAIPTLINRWFSQRAGLFMGICFAMSGVGGAVWSMVGGLIIDASTWRVAYQVFSALVLVIGLFATLVCVRSYPEEVGLRPFGAQPLQESSASAHGGKGLKLRGVSASVMFRSPVFYLLIFSMGIFNALTVTVNLYATYIHHLGALGLAGITPDGAVIMASVVASCLMAVSAGSKVLLGAISDKSMIGALAIAFVGGVVSICCMWLWAWSPEVIVFGGALGGVLYAAIDALAPSITRQIVGPRDYTIIYSRVAIVVNLAGAVAATVFAAVAEASWEAEWVMSLILLTVAFASCVAAVRFGKNLEQTLE
jgi:MFS family permease